MSESALMANEVATEANNTLNSLTSGTQESGFESGSGQDEGLSKLQLLRNQFRSKIVEEKEKKLVLLNKKAQKPNRKVRKI